MLLPSESLPTITETEIYAAYGRALALAQSMETGMRIFYFLDEALPKAPPGKLPKVNLDDEPIMEINLNSLGGFLRRFRRELFQEGEIDVETRQLMRRLEQSADDRNRLVHTYWWERSAQLVTPAGRVLVLAELRDLIAQFQHYDQIIRGFIFLYFQHYGLDPFQMNSDKFLNYLTSGSQIRLDTRPPAQGAGK